MVSDKKKYFLLLCYFWCILTTKHRKETREIFFFPNKEITSVLCIITNVEVIDKQKLLKFGFTCEIMKIMIIKKVYCVERYWAWWAELLLKHGAQLMIAVGREVEHCVFYYWVHMLNDENSDRKTWPLQFTVWRDTELDVLKFCMPLVCRSADWLRNGALCVYLYWGSHVKLWK